MSDQKQSLNEDERPEWDGKERPLSLVEVLVAEYEEQCEERRKMNPCLPELDLPYSKVGEITKKCNEVAECARKIQGTDSEQYEYFCRETDKLAAEFYQAIHSKKVKRIALCLSGGGIRSATFGLGLLQGLTRHGVKLSRIHYLSTVSGGGYIGSWLSAWIHRQGVERVQHALSCSSVIEKTGPQKAQMAAQAEVKNPPGQSAATPEEKQAKSGNETFQIDPDHSAVSPEPNTIHHLRRFSNYMSPKLGVLSADTWTLAGTFLRNLFLNWTVLIPLAAAVLAIPRLVCSAVNWNASGHADHPIAAWIALALAGLVGIISVAYQVANLPSWREQSRIRSPLRTEKSFKWFCLMTLVSSAFLCAFFWSWIHKPETFQPKPSLLAFSAFGVLVHCLGYLVVRWRFIELRWQSMDAFDFLMRFLTGALGGILLWTAALAFPVPGRPHQHPASTLTISSAPELTGILISVDRKAHASGAAAQELSLRPAWKQEEKQEQEERLRRERDVGLMKDAALYTVFAPPLFLVVFLVAASVFIGVASTYTTDADREWMARAGSWILIALIGWSVLSGLVIFGPVGLIWLWREFKISLLSISGLSGLLSVIGGFSSKTSASKKDSGANKPSGLVGTLLSRSLPLAASLFTAILVAALSLATSLPIKAVLCGRMAGDIWWHLDVLFNSPAILAYIVILFLLLLGLAMGFFININKFSLHSAYRDRLIRAYLGASQGSNRHPNPFTGFDDADNIQMHDLLTKLFRPASFSLNNPSALALLSPPQSSAGTPQAFVANHISDTTRPLMRKNLNDPQNAEELKQALADDFNHLIGTEDLYHAPEFQQLIQDPKVKELAGKQPELNRFGTLSLPGPRESMPRLRKFSRKVVFVDKVRINRLLVEKAFGDLILPSSDNEEPRPLHLINVALNLVGGKELAWQERKAQSFTVSPLHVGSHRLGYREATRYGISHRSNSAISLGTALAISGAAISPNMGYHSSPMVTLLLTLFNVRLGWWLGNPGPAGAKTFSKSSPVLSSTPLLAEMLGMTDSEHAYVYLSDGGHFENLALYEMVRRRCRYIILSDAGEDAEFKFDDLGNALRKIRIDLGVPIEFKEFSICPSIAPDALFVPRDSAGHGSPKYYAIGMIRYSAIDGGDPKEVDGTLLYIKPAMHGDEPPDVRNYAKANVPFPHETTGDQMYSESQFESYRALGEFIIGEIAKEQQIKDMLEDMNRPDGQPGL